MSESAALAGMYSQQWPMESRDRIPVEVSGLLAATPGRASDEAWGGFVARYSELLIRAASAFGPGYDGALDRYAFMLDELRKGDYRRLRKFAADGRGRFSTWLMVVARRLCLDHYRRQFGRFRGPAPAGSVRALARSARRELTQLESAVDDPADLPAAEQWDPTDELDDRERRARLRHAMAQLAPGDQLLLRLRFEDDLTAREMATVLGLPSPFHVYRRLEALYQALRRGLGPPPMDDCPGYRHPSR